MINRGDVFTIHKLWNQGFTKRQIARKLQLDRGTVTNYLANPAPATQKRRVKQSKLDPYKSMVEEMIEQCQTVKAPVVLQRLIEKGFDGEITIVRNLLRKLRGLLRCTPHIVISCQFSGIVRMDREINGSNRSVPRATPGGA